MGVCDGDSTLHVLLCEALHLFMHLFFPSKVTSPCRPARAGTNLNSSGNRSGVSGKEIVSDVWNIN